MHDSNIGNDHDRGLAADLEVMARRGSERRRVLALLIAGGSLAVAGRSTGVRAADSTCEPTPRETAGPFPADGSNTRRGERLDVLDQQGVLRSDIRRSFGTSSTVAEGVPFELRMRMVAARRACAPLAGHAIYIWQADRRGEYSLYQGAAERENYLRGVQVSDANGDVRFITIYPSCYGGRYPHIHFEIFRATEGSRARGPATANRLLVSQLAMPAEHCRHVYTQAAGYDGSRENFARMATATDGVFRDNTAAQLAAMTPRLRGNPAEGYTGEVTIAV